jgi:AAA+ superfamily predicted ATPase
MRRLDRDDPERLPDGLTLEKTPAFVPRMVMTDELKVVVREVVRQWRHRKRFEGLRKFGIRPLDRLLFHGPPGNGKTMACQWISKELSLPLYRVQCEQLRGSAAFGHTVRTLSAITSYLDGLTAPAVCLFDEIESLFIDRARSVGVCDREVSSALTVFFQALDRWKAPVLLVMCTNLFDQLDAALVSRTEMQLEFCGPTRDQAQQVVEYWRELLHEYGGDDWGPKFAEAIDEHGPPESFRKLQQAIARAARDWVASGIEDGCA